MPCYHRVRVLPGCSDGAGRRCINRLPNMYATGEEYSRDPETRRVDSGWRIWSGAGILCHGKAAKTGNGPGVDRDRWGIGLLTRRRWRCSCRSTMLHHDGRRSGICKQRGRVAGTEARKFQGGQDRVAPYSDSGTCRQGGGRVLVSLGGWQYSDGRLAVCISTATTVSASLPTSAVLAAGQGGKPGAKIRPSGRFGGLALRATVWNILEAA